jgi:hypothetical protein
MMDKKGRTVHVTVHWQFWLVADGRSDAVVPLRSVHSGPGRRTPYSLHCCAPGPRRVDLVGSGIWRAKCEGSSTDVCVCMHIPGFDPLIKAKEQKKIAFLFHDSRLRR